MKQTSSYPISSEDMHWANHTENQQHNNESEDDVELCAIWISEVLVAMIWKKQTVWRNHTGQRMVAHNVLEQFAAKVKTAKNIK